MNIKFNIEMATAYPTTAKVLEGLEILERLELFRVITEQEQKELDWLRARKAGLTTNAKQYALQQAGVWA